MTVPRSVQGSRRRGGSERDPLRMGKEIEIYGIYAITGVLNVGVSSWSILTEFP